MFNRPIISMLGQYLFAAAVLAMLATNMVSSTCTGSDPCNACKDCKYCKHCAKDGGSCGVCRRAQNLRA
jgi:hypothetical protein